MTTPRSPKDLYQKLLKRRMMRFRIIWLVLLLFFVALIIRLADLQLVSAQEYKQKSQRLRSQSLVIYHRGRILDRNGVILAQDNVLYDVFAHPRYYYKTPPETIAKDLAPILKQPYDKMLAQLKQPYDTIRLATNIPKEQAKAILAMKLSGIEAPRKMVRRYPQGNLASHLLGYVNDDASIASGIEKSAENTLRNAPDMKGVELNGHGDFINVEHVPTDYVTSLPKADDVILTLDARMQYVAEAALAAGLERTKARRGAVIITNPKNGEILAFAVLPDFDPEKYFKAEPAALKNWAMTDVYPPGSTFKILTVASGIETGVINERSHLYDTGYVKMGGFTIKNYDYSKRGAPGDIDLVGLFEHSSNVGSLLISLMMEPKEHYRILKQFGLGDKTGIDIPGESAGIIHPPEEWDQLTHATIGFGYGLASTPIQMAAAIGAIANDGVWVTPHILRNQENVTKHRAISAETAHQVTDLLARSIDAQKSATVRLAGYRVAGKTGTSRKPNDNGKGYSNQVFTSFVGYMPVEDPQVLVMVVVDSPGIGNAWGNTVAGPIFHDVATQIVGYLGLKPDIIASEHPPAAQQ